MPCAVSLLTLAHTLWLLQCEEDGQVFFSLDDGATKFTDLIQLVEFYQLNRGVLPCKLKHPCTVVALWHLRIIWPPWPLSLDLTLPKTNKTTRTFLLVGSFCFYLPEKLVNWLMFCCLRFILSWVRWKLLTCWIHFGLHGCLRSRMHNLLMRFRGQEERR